ncbi:ubiquinone anaerobic biosynthesis accessory factor UbiT [Celerinatantimonas diazotrophica]|uniref:ubiquinone anaerobic biosynthesis accessory factor UbiT n=1 Tax=Celerinatantimonas diazotrophica TaxID=412034 RepID=UPI001404BC7E|nr:SCP2 sterol-binding domain-containing protein [Celerinatantimonas diazotrophica]
MPLFQSFKQQLVQKGPTLARLPVKWVPFPVQRSVMELALNQLLKESASEGELDFLTDRWVALKVRDIKGCWMLTFADGKLKVFPRAQGADVSFSGNLNDFLVMVGRREDPDTLFFQRRLSIEGDTQLGLEVKNLLDNIDYDELPQPVHHLLTVLSGWVVEQNIELAHSV